MGLVIKNKFNDFHKKAVIWADLFGDYEVSTHGQVHNKVNNIMIKPQLGSGGYFVLSLQKKMYRTNRLVAQVFLSNPDNLPVVNHMDGNKLNNHISNLEWMTYSQNSQHAVDTNLGTSCKQIDQYSMGGQFIKRWTSIIEASEALNIHRAGIGNNCQGRSKSSGGFVWKYSNEESIVDRKEFTPTTDFIDIEGFPNYKISPKGEIYSKYTKALMKPYNVEKGYRQIDIKKFKEPAQVFGVHILVAKHFLPNPDNLPIVNHIDGNKDNNNVENLEWTTQSQNIQHAVDIGRKPPTNEAPVLQYDLEGNFIAEYKSISEASRQTKLVRRCIGKTCKGLNKTCGGFLWKYKFPDKVMTSNPKPSLTGNQLRKVAQMDKDGNIIKIWDNVIEASEKLIIEKKYIYAVCGETRWKTAGGFKWKYVD